MSDVASMFEAIAEYNDLITEARTTGDPQLRAQVKGRRTVEAASQQRIRATLRAALNQAIKERKIDLNVASLVELEGGKRPKALIWTEERVAAWQEVFNLHVAETKARKRLFAAVDGDSRHGRTANALDAYIGAPRPSVVMVWTPKRVHPEVIVPGRCRPAT